MIFLLFAEEFKNEELMIVYPRKNDFKTFNGLLGNVSI
jgi:hypothetical protein